MSGIEYSPADSKYSLADSKDVRALIIVLGDQLDMSAAGFDGFDPDQDMVWMAEVVEESTHVWSSKPRIAMFLSAMRHFASAVREKGWRLSYAYLDDEGNAGTLAAELESAIRRFNPEKIIMTAPGDWRVWKNLSLTVDASGRRLEIRSDRHFYSTVRDFAAYTRDLQGRPIRMEYFYRHMRRRHGVLMDDGEPVDGQWNFDKSNRHAFGKSGPGITPERLQFTPDRITQEVLTLVEEKFAAHPGHLDSFVWPVTRPDALTALTDFIENKLPVFGPYQDAMWPDEPWLYHSQLSAALNLKLLNAKEVVDAAERAFRSGHVPLASAEGFIRQILGWREYVRGIYWTKMPDYVDSNALDADQALPAWYWTGDTDFECLAQTIRQTLQHGYAHHIQRLMVTGLFALLLGVRPKAVHEWYLSVYVDAVEWVELPNTVGMSQYGDGGIMASKPYIATGKYIERMGGPCAQCKYNPGESLGETACPFTTLYWRFLIRHEVRLAREPRLVHQVRRLADLDAAQRQAIAERADAIAKGTDLHAKRATN